MLTATILTLLLAGEAAAAPPAPVVAKPEWIGKPDGDAVNRYYPDLASRLSISGRLKLRCDVTAAGEVINCKVQDETPVGLGFGEAAIGLSQYFKMKTTTPDGESVAGASVLIPLSFAAPDEAAFGPPRNYRVALGCITWNRARLDLMGDAESTASLAQAERHARELGAEEGVAQTVIDANLADAGKAGAAVEKMRTNPFQASTCLFLPI